MTLGRRARGPKVSLRMSKGGAAQASPSESWHQWAEKCGPHNDDVPIHNHIHHWCELGDREETGAQKAPGKELGRVRPIARFTHLLNFTAIFGGTSYCSFCKRHWSPCGALLSSSFLSSLLCYLQTYRAGIRAQPPWWSLHHTT